MSNRVEGKHSFLTRLLLSTCAVLLFFCLLHYSKSYYALFRGWLLRQEALPVDTEKLKKVHETLDKAEQGGWLYEHLELGQSVNAFKKQIYDSNGKIYIFPVAESNWKHPQILKALKEYFEISFCAEVEVKDLLLLDKHVPSNAKRYRQDLNTTQYRTEYILNQIVKPHCPVDSLACIGITDSDLWPGRGWNFVYGQALPESRLGIWSTHRFQGDLKRIVAVAAHETGHILGIRHCLAYKCLMCGSNNYGEATDKPMLFCPHCLEKLRIHRGCDLRDRYQKLLKFFNREDFFPTEAFSGDDVFKKEKELINASLEKLN